MDEHEIEQAVANIDRTFKSARMYKAKAEKALITSQARTAFTMAYLADSVFALAQIARLVIEEETR